MADQNKSNLWLIIGAVLVVLAVVYWFMSSGTAPDQAAPVDMPEATAPETGPEPGTEPGPESGTELPSDPVETAPVQTMPADPVAPAGN